MKFTATLQIITEEGVRCTTVPDVALGACTTMTVVMAGLINTDWKPANNDSVYVTEFRPPRLRDGDGSLHVATFWITREDLVEGRVVSAHTTGRLLYTIESMDPKRLLEEVATFMNKMGGGS